MKILSVIVPCYNAQDYMHACIDSLLKGGDMLEIILVNDGSTDETAAIAEKYKEQFSERIQVIHQKNKGHGGAINTGLKAATGEFVKIVDSDDWVGEHALWETIETLSAFAPEERPDMLISNYVYEKVGKRRKTAIGYKNVFPTGRLFTWDETKPFRLGQYMLMHALIYRRTILEKSKLKLPEHTFYVDNLYAYVPLAKVETLYYLNVDLYHYFIGREGQSVHEQTMIRRINQQLAVNSMMIRTVDLTKILSSKKRRYLVHYLEIVTAVSSVLLIKEGSAESLEKKDVLWRTLKEQDPNLYDSLLRRFLGRFLYPRAWVMQRLALFVYYVSRLVVGFN